MSKPFTEIKTLSRLRKKPKPVPYMTRLPASVIRFLKSTARKHDLTQEQLVHSLLLAGIQAFEKEKPLQTD